MSTNLEQLPLLTESFVDDVSAYIDDGTSEYTPPNPEVYDYIEDEEKSLVELYEFGMLLDFHGDPISDGYPKEIIEERNHLNLEELYVIIRSVCSRWNKFQSEQHLPAFFIEHKVVKDYNVVNNIKEDIDAPFPTDETLVTQDFIENHQYINVFYRFQIYFNKIKDMSYAEFSTSLYRLQMTLYNETRNLIPAFKLARILYQYGGKKKDKESTLFIVRDGSVSPRYIPQNYFMSRIYHLYVLGNSDYSEFSNTPSKLQDTPSNLYIREEMINRYRFSFADRVRNIGVRQARAKYNLNLDIIGTYFDTRPNYSISFDQLKMESVDSGFITIKVSSTDGSVKLPVKKLEECILSCVFDNIPDIILGLKYIYVIVRPEGLMYTDYVSTNSNSKKYDFKRDYSVENESYYKNTRKYLWRIREVIAGSNKFISDNTKQYIVLTDNKGKIPGTAAYDLSSSENTPLYWLIWGIDSENIWISQDEIEKRAKIIDQKIKDKEKKIPNLMTVKLEETD